MFTADKLRFAEIGCGSGDDTLESRDARFFAVVQFAPPPPEETKAMKLSARLCSFPILALALGLYAVNSAKAIKMNEIESTIQQCRADPQHCKCPSAEVGYIPCSIEKADNHCGRYPKWSNPNADVSGWNACMDQCKADNQLITEYNNLAGTCRRSEKNTPEKQPPTKPIASDKTDWTKTKIDAQKKTQGADAVNAENLKKIDTEIAKTSNDLAEQRKKLEADAARNAANQAAVAKTIPHEATIIPRAKYPPLPDSGMEIDDLRHRTLDDLRHRGSFCYESPDGYACDCCRFRIATYSFRNMNVGQCYDSHWLGIEFITEPGFFEDQVTWRPNPALGQVLNRRIEVICLKDRNTFLSEHPN